MPSFGGGPRATVTVPSFSSNGSSVAAMVKVPLATVSARFTVKPMESSVFILPTPTTVPAPPPTATVTWV